MKKFTLSLAALTIAASASAIPVAPRPQTLPLPDGTLTTVTPVGDEYSLHYIDARGRQLQLDGEGFLRDYVAPEQNSTPIFRSPGLHSTTYNRTYNGGYTSNVVILVEFTDVKFSTPNPREFFNRWLNESGFSEYGNAGSIRDYFIHQSGGKFVPTFDVYGPVTLSKSRANYKISGGSAANMVIEGTRLADAQIDFSKYCMKNSGTVDNVTIIYAGVGRNEVTSSDAPWPHNSTTSATRDGKQISHYMVINERNGSDTEPAAIGTFIHEFGHVLGLPDLYNTTGQNDYTPGFWSVMDVGSYLNGSKCPCNYGIFERNALDWIDNLPVLDADPATVRLPCWDQSGFGVRLETGRSGDSYFIEYRKPQGFDSYICGNGDSGMLIWHVDLSNTSAFDSNPNGDSSHLRVDVIEANGTPAQGNNNGQIWPGSTGKTEFSGNSTPAMFRWNSSSGTASTVITDRPITNISVSSWNGYVEFNYRGGSTSNVISQNEVISEVISVSANPENGGTVYINTEGTTSVNALSGTQYTLHATPAANYAFQNWSHHGQVVGTSSTYYIIPQSAEDMGAYIATFKWAGSEPEPIEYTHPTGNSASGSRYTSAVNVSDGTTSHDYSGMQGSSNKQIYWQQTAAFATNAGSTITVTPNTTGTWLHTYLYVDWNSNGFDYDGPQSYLQTSKFIVDEDGNETLTEGDYSILPGADLVYYSRFSPDGIDPDQGGNWYNSSDGLLDYVKDNHNFTPSTPISFTIPASTPSGTYRARLKIAWNSLDPDGGIDPSTGTNNAISNLDGGFIMDFPLQVTAKAPSSTTTHYLQITIEPTGCGQGYIDGEATHYKTGFVDKDNDGAVLHVEPIEGYVFSKWIKGQKRELVSENQTHYIPLINAYNAGTYTAVVEPAPVVNSISEVITEEERTEMIYDLQGRQVRHTSRGLYIVNGHKVIR